MLAVGATARRLVESFEKSVMCDELGVELSDKTEVNKLFPTTFQFIGTEFDASEANKMRRLPAMQIRQSLKRGVEWIHKHRCRLVDRAQLQTAVGRHTFCWRFVHFGRSLLNLFYAALAGAVIYNAVATRP